MSAISKNALLSTAVSTEGLSITALSVSIYFCLQTHSIDYICFCLNLFFQTREEGKAILREISTRRPNGETPQVSTRPAPEEDGGSITQGQQQVSRTGSNGAGDLLNRVSPMNLTFTPWPRGSSRWAGSGSNGVGDLLNRVSPMNLTFTPWPFLSPIGKRIRNGHNTIIPWNCKLKDIVCGGSIKKMGQPWCLCCMMMFRRITIQPGIQKFWHFLQSLSCIYDRISPLNKLSDLWFISSTGVYGRKWVW